MSKHNLTDSLRYAGFTTAYDNILNPASEPWRGHIAFARVLMAEFRPELFVELGTYYGVSFFAVCQAVKEEGLATRCYAVDSWEGDSQAGFYENEVYDAVKTHADTHYPAFTTLIRSLFDDALLQFKDESIDVLHIDGLHTYEAVRHDFDTWLPKVKPGGIILFHDVNEYREDFGAHRVWDEIVLLSEESYLFRHSHGLGVWRKPGGAPISTPLLSALLGPDRSEATLVDTYITALADKEIYRIVSWQRQEELIKKQGELEEQANVIQMTRDEVNRTWDEVNRTRDEADRATATLNDTRDALTNTWDELNSSRREVDRVTNEYIAVREALRQELVAANRVTDTVRDELDAARNELSAVLLSHSWKLTRPLRESCRMARSLIRPGSQCGVFAKLVRGLCALPASVVFYPTWTEWKQALRSGPSFFTTIEVKAPQVFEYMQARNTFSRAAVTLPLKFGLKIRQFGGVFPALTRGIKKLRTVLAKGDFKQLLPVAYAPQSAPVSGVTEKYMERHCGPLMPGLRLAQTRPTAPVANPASPVHMIDVIIPVYNGRAHLESLLPSLFANTNIPHRFVFIDDKSPDPELWPWLQEQIADRNDCLLLQNEENLGFPATVNRGAALSDGNFVILNTDTVVPVDWLERLIAPLLADPAVASATPFSNAATIFSFPMPNDDTANTAFLENMGLETINTALTGLEAPFQLLEAPTGVGFCMAISRKAWDGHFGFDAERFGKGYGEEVDWCQRSLRSGWKHVLVPNLYVAHSHGGSFTPEIKAVQLLHAEETVNALHPGYTTAVSRHLEADPWATLRTAALMRLAANPSRKPVLYLGHGYGGGAALYLERRVAAETADGNAALTMIYDARLREYTFTIALADHRFHCSIASPLDLRQTDLSFLTAICVNNLAGWPLVSEGRSLLEDIPALAEKNGVELEILFHDFYPVCPRVTLLTPECRFCDLPTDMAVCTRCANTDSDMNTSMTGWRQSWQSLLNQCTRLTFFSRSTMELISRAYTLTPECCQVLPHAPLRTFNQPYAVPAEAPLCVALAGHINCHKGSGIVEKLAALMAEKHPEARILVIGVFEGKQAPNMTVTGPYDGDQLPAILAQHTPTVALFPSICPETFSYVVQEWLMLEMPLVCFDLGAPAERVRDYPLGLVVEEVSAPAALKALEELDSRRTNS